MNVIKYNLVSAPCRTCQQARPCCHHLPKGQRGSLHQGSGKPFKTLLLLRSAAYAWRH